MGRAVALAILTLFFGASPVVFEASAQAQSFKGALRGRVEDGDFLQAIGGVRIIVEGTDKTALTDSEGNFFINEINAGTCALVLSKEGYVRQRETGIVVTAGTVREVNLKIFTDVFELDEFVVTGEDLIASEDVANLDVRQSLESFADIIGADFISQTGASDAGEALMKIVGTSVVDSKYVVVRGLSDRYNTVVLNRAKIPSSDPDRRAVNVDIFPGGLIESLTNSKTFTADLPGESTGGYINIETKAIPEKDFIGVSVGNGFNNQSTYNERFVSYPNTPGTGIFGTADERAIPKRLQAFDTTDLPSSGGNAQVVANREEAALLVKPVTGVSVRRAPQDVSFGISAGKRLTFAGRPLGILAAMTYSKSYKLDEDAVFGSATSGGQSELLVGPIGEESLLTGILVAGGLELSDNDLLKLTFFTNWAAEDLAGFQFRRTGEGGPDAFDLKVPATDLDEFSIRETIAYTERRLSTLQAGGEHRFGDEDRVEVDWVAAYSESSQEQPDSRYMNEIVQGDRFVSAVAGSGTAFERTWQELQDTNYNLDLSVKVPLFREGNGGKEAFARFGGAYDYSTRNYRADNYAYNFAAITTFPVPDVFVPDNRIELTPADQLGEDDRTNTSPRRPNRDGIFLFRNGSAETYTASQSIAAAYGMATFDLSDNFRLTAGARVESFDFKLRTIGLDTENPSDPSRTAALKFDLETGEELPPDEIGKADINQVDMLPMAGATWEFADNMQLRVAAARTVARPSFKEVAPVITRDPASGTRVAGNIRLQPSTISNFDTRFEWFPGEGNVIAASFFTKLIDQPIERTRGGSFDFFVNEDSGVLYGFELEAQTRLDGLMPQLHGAAIGFNYTKLVSNVQLSENSVITRTGAGLDATRPLQGQPDYIMNFNMTYDNEDWGLFAGLFLNVTGPLLFAAGGLEGDIQLPDVFQKPFTSLDLTLSKQISKNWKVTFRAENLANAKLERRYSNGAIDEIVRAGTKYSIGFSADW